VLVVAVVMFVYGLATGLFLLLLPDPSGHTEATIVLTVVLTGPLGLWVIYWAIRLAVTAIRSAVAFHRIDLPSATSPTRVVVSGWMRRRVVDLADLTWVMVRQRKQDLEIVLRTTGKTVVCPANFPTSADPQVLTMWLGEVLARSEIPVRHCDATWDGLLPPYMVARIWGVPESDVVMLATRCEVRTTQAHRGPIFDGYDVEWCAEQVSTITAHDQHNPPPT
jgi:hypothetical protein